MRIWHVMWHREHAIWCHGQAPVLLLRRRWRCQDGRENAIPINEHVEQEEDVECRVAGIGERDVMWNGYGCLCKHGPEGEELRRIASLHGGDVCE